MLVVAWMTKQIGSDFEQNTSSIILNLQKKLMERFHDEKKMKNFLYSRFDFVYTMPICMFCQGL